MAVFRLFLVVAFAVIAAYTLVVVQQHGANLFPAFFGEVAAMTWSGQFNTDFSFFLLLTGMWIAWRHDFSSAGLLLALIGVFGGMLYLSAYLLVQSYACNGDVRAILLGKARAAG